MANLEPCIQAHRSNLVRQPILYASNSRLQSTHTHQPRYDYNIPLLITVLFPQFCYSLYRSLIVSFHYNWYVCRTYTYTYMCVRTNHHIDDMNCLMYKYVDKIEYPANFRFWPSNRTWRDSERDSNYFMELCHLPFARSSQMPGCLAIECKGIWARIQFVSRWNTAGYTAHHAGRHLFADYEIVVAGHANRKGTEKPYRIWFNTIMYVY